MYLSHAGKGGSKLLQGRKNGAGILDAGLDEKIEVFGGAGLSVNRPGVPADDEVLNVVFVERGQQFFEVLTEHRALIPSTDTPLPIAPRRYPAALGPGGFASSGTPLLSSY